MRTKAIVTERGTITIPEGIRKTTHINPGDIIEFTTNKSDIIMKRLVVNYPDDKNLLTNNEWKTFDNLVKRQLRRGDFTAYSDLDSARTHSQKLQKK